MQPFFELHDATKRPDNAPVIGSMPEQQYLYRFIFNRAKRKCFCSMFDIVITVIRIQKDIYRILIIFIAEFK